MPPVPIQLGTGDFNPSNPITFELPDLQGYKSPEIPTRASLMAIRMVLGLDPKIQHPNAIIIINYQMSNKNGYVVKFKYITKI